MHLLQLEDCYFNTHLSIKISLKCGDLHVMFSQSTSACMLCNGGATELEQSVFLPWYLTATGLPQQ